MKLKDQVAIVTGAGRGVGQATALMLAADGARVVVNDLDQAEAEATVAAITAAGGQAIACSGDVTAADFPDQLIATTLDAWGTIDIIVNNAGYIWNGAMHKHSDEQWQAMLDIHATAPFRILRAFAPWLRVTASARPASVNSGIRPFGGSTTSEVNPNVRVPVSCCRKSPAAASSRPA